MRAEMEKAHRHSEQAMLPAAGGTGPRLGFDHGTLIGSALDDGAARPGMGCDAERSLANPAGWGPFWDEAGLLAVVWPPMSRGKRSAGR